MRALCPKCYKTPYISLLIEKKPIVEISCSCQYKQKFEIKQYLDLIQTIKVTFFETNKKTIEDNLLKNIEESKEKILQLEDYINISCKNITSHLIELLLEKINMIQYAYDNLKQTNNDISSFLKIIYYNYSDNEYYAKNINRIKINKNLKDLSEDKLITNYTLDKLIYSAISISSYENANESSFIKKK